GPGCAGLGELLRERCKVEVAAEVLDLELPEPRDDATALDDRDLVDVDLRDRHVGLRVDEVHPTTPNAKGRDRAERRTASVCGDQRPGAGGGRATRTVEMPLVALGRGALVADRQLERPHRPPVLARPVSQRHPMTRETQVWRVVVRRSQVEGLEGDEDQWLLPHA